MRNSWRSLSKQLIWFTLGLMLIAWLGLGEPSSSGKVMAQSSPYGAGPNLRVEDAAKIVYQKLPYLPLENQYIRQETGQVDPEYTLINRFIRYHQDVKKRATRYRFDWKITFADYLDVNEAIAEKSYPGSQTLTVNPMQTDVKQIQSLNRRQRQELADLLAQIYRPQIEKVTPTPDKNPKKPNQPTVVDPTKPGLSQPGDSQLLKF